MAVAMLVLLAFADEAPDLDRELRDLRIPPPWLAEVASDYDTSLPWKQARIQIRKLLDEQRNREAIKLTYDYLVVREAAPDDHEYPLYLYLGGEYAWAVAVYRERIGRGEAAEAIAYLNLASLYRHFGELAEAGAVLRLGLDHLPKPPWDIPGAAKIHDRLGDLQAGQGRTAEALREYAEAMRLYPASKQPYGKQNLPKEGRKIQSKVDLLKRGNGDFGPLRDGVYQGTSIGYSGEVAVTLTVRQGRVAEVAVAHREHIDQRATVRIPQAIRQRQSLDVDAITGATVTTQAIVAATHQAARKAGMK
jgi:tetratricopeptide (TPR) repeat protein